MIVITFLCGDISIRHHKCHRLYYETVRRIYQDFPTIACNVWDESGVGWNYTYQVDLSQLYNCNKETMGQMNKL